MPLPRWTRRLLGPVWVAVEVVLLAVFALTTLVGLGLAPFDRSRRVLRIGAMGIAYLGVEIAALVALAVVAVARRAHPEDWWEQANGRVLAWALGAILTAARRALGFVVTVEGQSPPRPSSPLDDATPVLVLARHGGPGDSFALVWLLLDRYRRMPRVVLKEVLQWEPLLDLTLNRLGAVFVPASPSSGDGLAASLGAMACGLRGRDALLIFPEGGNWTPGRRRRAIRRLWADRKYRAAGAAVAMPHVLPPRPAGVLACLEARPDLSVVVFAHTGLDTLTTAGQIYRAIPFQRPMTVRWWPARPVPRGPDAQLDWLMTEWARVDEWIDAAGAKRR